MALSKSSQTVYAKYKKIIAALVAIALFCTTLVSTNMHRANADNLYLLASQYDFIDSAFSITDRQVAPPKLESISPGWTWHQGSIAGSLVYNYGYYNGAYPLESTFLYKNIGKVDGRWIDGRLRINNVGRWASPYGSINYSKIDVTPFWGGQTFFCCASIDVTYSMYWSDTGELMPMTDAWMTVGSLNTNEGVRYNSSGKIDSIVLSRNNLRQVAQGYWVGISNDFDDWCGGGTFARNAVCYKIKEPTMHLTMTSTFGAMWMFPLFTPLMNVRPGYPEKTCEVLD